MTALLLPLLLTLLQDGDTYQLDITFESMHCAECKTELEGVAERLPGLRSAKIRGNRLLLTLSERAPVPSLNRFPKEIEI